MSNRDDAIAYVLVKLRQAKFKADLNRGAHLRATCGADDPEAHRNAAYVNSAAAFRLDQLIEQIANGLFDKLDEKTQGHETRPRDYLAIWNDVMFDDTDEEDER
jgi:hypothetical protein